MSLRIFKPAAMVELKTGIEGSPPTMFRWAEIWRRNLSTNKEEPHPAFLDLQNKPRQMRELDIELISNIPEHNCGSHLSARDLNKTTVFCARNHRGLDELGIATRRGEDGEFFATICDPLKCDLRLNQVNNGSKTKRIAKQWNALYPDAALAGVNKRKELEAVKCRHEMFFIFRLLTPEGQYAHATGEFCLLHSHAETNHRIYRKLKDLADETNGNLAGLRLKLIYDEVATVHGRDKKPAWSIFMPEGTDLAALRRDAIERTTQTMTALALVSDQQALARVIEDNPDIVSMARAEERRAAQIKAEQGDPKEAGLIFFNPMVKEICERLDFTNLWTSSLPMICKNNLARLVHWAREQAANYTFTPYGSETKVKEPRSIEDILTRYGWGGTPVEPSAALEVAAPAPERQTVYTAPIDADFTVVEEPTPDPQVEMNAARGQIAAQYGPEYAAPTTAGALFPADALTKLPEELAEIEANRRDE